MGMQKSSGDPTERVLETSEQKRGEDEENQSSPTVRHYQNALFKRLKLTAGQESLDSQGTAAANTLFLSELPERKKARNVGLYQNTHNEAFTPARDEYERKREGAFRVWVGGTGEKPVVSICRRSRVV